MTKKKSFEGCRIGCYCRRRSLLEADEEVMSEGKREEEQ